MGYIRAEEVLPEEILALVQQYVDGQNIYVPRKENCHRTWGAGTKTKRELRNRNREMYVEYQTGVTMRELAEKYFLTEKSVQRIIRDMTTVQGSRQDSK